MPYMYMLECGDGSFYTGSTRNIEKRLRDHQRGKGARYTRSRLPVRLIYCEEYERVEDAYRREKQVQSWTRREKKALIKGNENKQVEFSKNYTQYESVDLALAGSTSTGSDFAKGSVDEETLLELVEGSEVEGINGKVDS